MPAPLVLGFDLAGAPAAAALVRGDDLLARAEAGGGPAGLDQRLIACLEGVLAAGGAGWRDLRGLGVGTGPGSHAGLRMAVAAARGLALGLGIPAVGVSRFEALAHGGPRPMLASVAGRGGAIWLMRFDADRAPRGPVPLPAEGLPETWGDGALPVAGDAAEAIAARTGGAARPPALPAAVAVARVAAARIAAGCAGGRPAPVYLGPPDAAPAPAPPPLLFAAAPWGPRA